MWMTKRGGILLAKTVEARQAHYAKNMGYPLNVLRRQLPYTPKAYDFYVHAEDNLARRLFHDFKEVPGG
jgi:hypothetical protein